MKLQNSFRDYTAESSLFVRRALVAFGDFAAYRRSDRQPVQCANRSLRRLSDALERKPHQAGADPAEPRHYLRSQRHPLALNRTIYQLEMMPEKVDNVQQTLDALRDVVDLTDDDIAGFKRSAPAPIVLPRFR